MNCPYCQNEMPLGHLPKAEFLLLISINLLKAHGYKAKAYYCQKCKIVLAHTQE